MTPERWRQVKELFNAACECAPERRSAFLDGACASDAELRREVESLLAAHEETGEFMRRPLTPVIAPDAGPTLGLEIGGRIGPYQVERQLGAGGIGVVYLARDTRLGRPIALKLLKARFTQDGERVRRFQQEARAASSLNHPNILTIHEVGQDSGLRFIATEFVDGQTLRERFSGGIQLGEALDLLIQVTVALGAAHEAGIVHRDVKPENIMVRRDGIVKVLDFGLAKLTERAVRPFDDELPRMDTRPGIVMGTVNYMSPEQVRGQEVDARSDLFSLGVVMYEMLAGRSPFAASTTGGVITSLLGDEPPPLGDFVPRLPAALQRISDRSLAKSVERRYQTAREMGDDLKRLKRELEFAAGAPALAAQHEGAIAMKVGSASQAAPDHSTLVDGRPVVDYATRDSGQPAVDYATRTDLKAAGRSTAQMAALISYLQRRGKAILLAATALVLIAAGIAAGLWRRSPQNGVIDSIAVLPFSNTGADERMEYLPDGLTESLIDSLSQLSNLRVSAHSTVSGYKGREVDPRQAGKELQAQAVVVGRVAQQGDRLIIRVELVDTANGLRVWGDEFQRARSDIVTAQGEIVREIAAKLHRRLSPANQRRLDKRHSSDSKAYELYAQGRSLYLQRNYQSQEKALDHFRQAIALDPRYALAYCGIADVYMDFSSQYMPPSEAVPKAREAALKAIELDETLPEAHHSLALVKWWGDWDWAGAEREFKRALELNTNLVHTLVYYADLLLQQKRFEEALRVIGQAEAYDPASLSALGREANAYLAMRQYDRAIETYRKVLRANPNLAGTKSSLSFALSQQGRHQEAIEQASQLRAPESSARKAYIYARAGQRDEALKLLSELKARAAHGPVPPVSFARVYIGLGDKEQAVFWLRKGYAERSDHLLPLGTDPAFDPLRSDPRFVELMRGIGLTR
jgi:serine/threonine-protein kinase